MRVLLLFEFPTLNGGENSLLSVVPTLSADGIALTAAAPAPSPLAAALEAAGIGLLPWEVRGTGGSLAARRERLQSLLRKLEPDLVHANSLSMARLAGPVCRQNQIASLGHLRDMLRPSRQALADLSSNSRLLAVSQATRDWYVRLGLPAHQVHVVYNGVDLERFCRRPAEGYLQRELSLPSSVRLIGAIGQLGLRKGVDVLLRAAAVALRHHGDVHCVLVGERHSEKAESLQYERSLQQLAQAPPLAGRVHFLGRRTDIPRLLSEFVVLVHLARQEPLGRVLLEAAAAGCCILATDVGGTAEIFPAKTGTARLVPAADASAAAQALHELLSSEVERRARGQAARRHVELHWDCHEAGRQLRQHYRALAVGKG